MMVHFDISPVSNATIHHIDRTLADRYYRSYYEIPFMELPEEEQQNILINGDILTEYEGRLVPTIGGMLIFGKDVSRKIPQSELILAIFKGTEITDELINKKTITGTLPEIIDNTVSVLDLFLPTASVIEGTKRKETILIPRKVIREAIVNAVAHRDYSIRNRRITAYLFQDRLEITSPGSLPNTLTLEKIKYGNSAPRNMFLIKYLDNMRYIDGLGRGIPMMLKEMQHKILFEELGELFRITIFHKGENGTLHCL